MMPYAPIYVIADKTNFFSNRLPSISLVQAEQNILGTNIARDVHTMFFNLTGMQGRNGTVVIGGKLTKEKVLAIDQLMSLCSNIILLGQVGFAFYCTMNNIEEPRVSVGARSVIKELLRCLQQELVVKPPEKLKRM
jgi:3-phosphoglycerate kinase